METTIITSLAQQTPGVFGVIIVVVYFLRAQSAMMAQWQSIFDKQAMALNELASRVSEMEMTLSAHDAKVGTRKRKRTEGKTRAS